MLMLLLLQLVLFSITQQLMIDTITFVVTEQAPDTLE